MITREVWQRSITDDQGNLLTGVQISVFQQDGITPATIYSGLTDAAMPNPFNTGVQTVARFYAEPGLYVVRAFKSGAGTQEWVDVDISGDSVRADIDREITRIQTTKSNVSPEDFIPGYSSLASEPTDYAGALALANDYCKANGACLSGAAGKVYPIKSTVTFDGRTSIGRLRVRAMTPFVGTDIVRFGSATAPITADSGIGEVYVDANALPACPVRFVDYRRCNVWSLKIENNVFEGGLITESEGYEAYFGLVNVSGPVPPLTAAPNASSSVIVKGSDCSFSQMAGSRNGRGLVVEGSGNKFSDLHFWGTYYNGHCKMRVCYHITGQSNILRGVTIDSPSRLDWGQPSSLGNGGVGVLIEGDAVDTTLISPYLFLSSAGDSKPTAGSIEPVRTSKARTKVICPTVRNDSGTVGANTEFVKASSSAVLRETTIVDAGPLMPENTYTAGSFLQGQPELRIGGVSTGVTYVNRRWMVKRSGSMCFVNINLSLMSRGGLSGVLVVPCPVANINEYGTYKVLFQCLIETQAGAVPAVGVLVNNGTDIALRNPETNAALTAAALTDTSSITLSGVFLTSTV